MKKLLASIILTLSIFMTAQAAMGIPDYFQPQNAALKDLNKTLKETVKAGETSAGDSGGGQQGAVDAANIALQYIANILLYFAAPLAVLFIARSGADYAFAMGEESKMENAKREFMWSLLGLALVMFSFVLVRAFIQPAVMLQDATNSNKTLQQATINNNVKEGQKKTATDPGAEAEAANEEAAAKKAAEAIEKKKAAEAAAAEAAIEESKKAVEEEKKKAAEEKAAAEAKA